MENIGNSGVSGNRITSKYTYLRNSPEFQVVLEPRERILTNTFNRPPSPHSFVKQVQSVNQSVSQSSQYQQEQTAWTSLLHIPFPYPHHQQSISAQQHFVSTATITQQLSPQQPTSITLATYISFLSNVIYCHSNSYCYCSNPHQFPIATTPCTASCC